MTQDQVKKMWQDFETLVWYHDTVGFWPSWAAQKKMIQQACFLNGLKRRQATIAKLNELWKDFNVYFRRHNEKSYWDQHKKWISNYLLNLK